MFLIELAIVAMPAVGLGLILGFVLGDLVANRRRREARKREGRRP